MTSNPTQALLGSTLGLCLVRQKSVLSIVTMDIANGNSAGADTSCAMHLTGKSGYAKKEALKAETLRAQKHV